MPLSRCWENHSEEKQTLMRVGETDRKEMIEDIKQKLNPRNLWAMVLGQVIKSGRSMKMD